MADLVGASLVMSDRQADASGFVYERDASMVFARTGAGKTIVYENTIVDWLEEGIVDRVLVVGPLRVVNLVWRQEAAKWKLPLTFGIVTGERSKAQNEEALAADTDILLTNYEMLPKVLDADHGCQGIIFDELSKLRKPTGKRQKRARRSDFVVRSGGTGSPAPNGLTSIFGMCHAVGLGAVVGRNYDRWLRTYFYPTDYMQKRWAPFERSFERLTQMLAPHVCVLDDPTAVLPPVVRVPVRFELNQTLANRYREMRRTSQLTDFDILAPSEGVLRLKLRQIASGFAYHKLGKNLPAARLDPQRLDVLADLASEMQGKPLLVAYEFREQLALMLERWPWMPWIGGGSTGDEAKIEAWATGKSPPLMAIHPASAGHGLNGLEQGSDSVAWWQLPDDAEMYQQLLGRLSRRSAKHPTVWSYEIAAVGTIDEAVLEMQQIKLGVQESLWEALSNARR